MKNRRLEKYLQAKEIRKKNEPILRKEEVPQNPDNHINQDFPGYPHGNANEKLINPGTTTEKKVAGVNSRDGEKMITTPVKKRQKREIDDGSGNAFEGTEQVKE